MRTIGICFKKGTKCCDKSVCEYWESIKLTKGECEFLEYVRTIKPKVYEYTCTERYGTNKLMYDIRGRS